MSGPARASRLSPWGRLVAACAIVVLGAAIALGAWSLGSAQERRVSYTVGGTLSGMELDLGDADVTVEGGGRRRTVAVQHVDRFGFGHGAITHLGPDILQAVQQGRLAFAVDQQAYLQGYLPIVLLAERARYGLFPAQGDVIPTGPNFVTKANAAQAIKLAERSIR